MATYKISYIAGDGTRRSYTLSSERQLTPASRANLNSNPLIREVISENNRRASDEGNPMHKHGGCREVTKITNVETGHYELIGWPLGGQL